MNKYKLLYKSVTLNTQFKILIISLYFNNGF